MREGGFFRMKVCVRIAGVSCLRRGTFPTREKYPKARQNQGFGILSGRQEGAVGRSLNFESSAVVRRCR